MADDQVARELERFLAERADRLMRTAVLLTGSREAGQDLLQTALERLLRHWRTLDGDPEGYLLRTLYNLAADGFRRQRRLQRKLLLLRAEVPAAADTTTEIDLRDALVRMLLQLPPRQRAVLVLRYWEQLTESETAIEELLRDGMERFTTGVRAPSGLARTASRLRRRRQAVRVAVSGGTAMVTAAAAVVVTVAVTGTAGGTRTQTTAYVLNRVENALADQSQVMRARMASSTWGPSVVLGYGPRNRFTEYTGNGCQHALPSGECTHQGGSEPYLSQGTALIDGKLTGVYVTYYNREWSLVPGNSQPPASACSRSGAQEMASPPPTPSDWANFIHATLGCGAATVTGHVRVNGEETTRITAKPVTAPLGRGEAKAVREKYVRVQWTLYVNPRTYLPVRLTGTDVTFGGAAPKTYGAGVTNIRWLQPTAANQARALVTIPPGFRQVSSPADQ